MAIVCCCLFAIVDCCGCCIAFVMAVVNGFDVVVESPADDPAGFRVTVLEADEPVVFYFVLIN